MVGEKANIQIEKVTAVTADGPKTLYNVEAIDAETGQTLSKTTLDDPLAADYLAEHLNKLHNDHGLDEEGEIPESPVPDADAAPTADPDTPLEAPPSSSAAPGQTPATGGTESGISPSESPPYQPGATAKPPKPGTTSASSALSKKARDLCGMAKDRKTEFLRLTEEQLAEQKINGVFGNKRVQSKPKRKKADSEVIAGEGVDNNAFIVIGNDRTGKLHEGYGGKGHTQCDSIDLVAGMGGPCPQEVEKVKTTLASGEEIEVERPKDGNPNFFIDAARIYISQKTDVDKNFGLGEFGPSGNKEAPRDPKKIGKYGAKSAVVAKADNIRIIARESLQIVTGTDKKNSQGGIVRGKSGIEIVAMNKYEELQPMVLGDNLIELLEHIVDKIDDLTKINNGYAKYQMKFNQAVTHHTHISPFFGIPTLPSEIVIKGGLKCDLEQTMKTEMSSLKQLTNLAGLKMNYLIDSGEKFINSRLNKCN